MYQSKSDNTYTAVVFPIRLSLTRAKHICEDALELITLQRTGSTVEILCHYIKLSHFSCLENLVSCNAVKNHILAECISRCFCNCKYEGKVRKTNITNTLLICLSWYFVITTTATNTSHLTKYSSFLSFQIFNHPFQNT